MDEHYFTADPTTPFRRVPVRTNVWGHWLELTSGSGVFAQGRLDIGTGVLLREAAPPVAAREVLDLGCGYGVIGLAVAVAVPEARVTAVDVNERALLLARENAEQLGVSDRFRAVLPDEVDAEATYDEIWSNPPIRVGKDALHALLLQWLPRLRPGRARGDGRGEEPRLGLAGRRGWASRATRRRSWPAPRVSACSSPAAAELSRRQSTRRSAWSGHALTALRACRSSGCGTSGSRWLPVARG